MIVPRGVVWPRRPKGDDYNKPKLTEAQARDAKTSTEPLKVTADRLGVSIPTVSKIRRGLTWRCLWE
jgi:hypothetical protein